MPDNQTGGAACPQAVMVVKVNDAVIAPAVEGELGQSGHEAREEGNEGETGIQPEEEVADLKVGADPAQPGAADVAEHRVTHMPYRSWCRHCVVERGMNNEDVMLAEDMTSPEGGSTTCSSPVVAA